MDHSLSLTHHRAWALTLRYTVNTPFKDCFAAPSQSLPLAWRRDQQSDLYLVTVYQYLSPLWSRIGCQYILLVTERPWMTSSSPLRALTKHHSGYNHLSSTMQQSQHAPWTSHPCVETRYATHSCVSYWMSHPLCGNLTSVTEHHTIHMVIRCPCTILNLMPSLWHGNQSWKSAC